MNYTKEWNLYKEKKDKNPELYEDFYGQASEKVLEAERKRRGNSNWKPTLLNGAYDFELKVRKVIFDEFI